MTYSAVEEEIEEGDWMAAAMEEAAVLEHQNRGSTDDLFSRIWRESRPKLSNLDYFGPVAAPRAESRTGGYSSVAERRRAKVQARDDKFGVHEWEYWSSPSMARTLRCKICGWQKNTHDE